MADQQINPQLGSHRAIRSLLDHLNEPVDREELHRLADTRLGEKARMVAAQLSDVSVSPRMIAGLIRMTDLVIVLVTGVLVYLSYVRTLEIQNGILSSSLLTLDIRYGLIGVAGALVTVLFIQALEGYTLRNLRSLVPQLGRVVGGLTLMFACFAVVAFFLKQSELFSRVWLGSWFVTAGVAFVVSRLFITKWVARLYREGRLQRRAVIIGGGTEAEELIRSLENQAHDELKICGIFDDRGDDRVPPNLLGYPKLGNLEDLIVFGRLCKIDMLIVSFPLTAQNRLAEMLKDLWVLPVDIRLSAHTDKLQLRTRSYSYVGSVPFLSLADRPLADWEYLKKRALDIVVATTALVALAPIMAMVALAIRLESRGPVLFRQTRYGFNNEKISVLKFRSMYHEMEDKEAKVVVTRNDPRVTKVGQFIRKSSLDELPQFWNVLKGELSVVGPRPHAIHAHTANQPWEIVVDGYFARHKVKPGVTGWAQVNGLRGEIRDKEMIRKRVEYDLDYIENWSIWFDLKIIFITPIRLLDTQSAY